jgi:hypothetical protein
MRLQNYTDLVREWVIEGIKFHKKVHLVNIKNIALMHGGNNYKLNTNRTG